MKRKQLILSSIMALILVSAYGCDKGDAIGGCTTVADCPSVNLYACDHASGTCVELQSCTNEKKDVTETDVDCGGAICGPCEKNRDCKKNSDCKSGYCDDGICADRKCEDDDDCSDAGAHSCNETKGTCNTCSDNKRNGTETDVDCGGPCDKKCAAGKKCKKNRDCLSGECVDGICEATGCQNDNDCKNSGTVDSHCDTDVGVCYSCSDGVKNGNETDIDCGGSDDCTRCTVGKTCKKDSDCSSAKCENKKCASAGGTNNPPPPPPVDDEVCDDDIKNGDETDVDCGGSCGKCDNGKACKIPSDCKSGNCDGNVCKTQSVDPVDPCSNGNKDAGEADIDCGGSCSKKCANGKSCTVASDCESGNCDGNVCKDIPVDPCKDGVKSGDESDVDCGGSCSKKCGNESACNSPADCVSYNCVGGLCKGNACDSANPQEIIISEVMTNPNTGKVMAHSNSKQMKFIELYNKTGKSLALTDLSLKAGSKEIAVTGCLPSKAYVILSDSAPAALDIDAKTMAAKVNDAIDANVTSLTLTKRSDGTKIHAVTIPSTSSGVSAGIKTDVNSAALDETMIPHSDITPANSAAKVECSPGLSNNVGAPEG